VRLRRVLVVGSCGAAAVLGFAGMAWACVGEVVSHASLGVSPSRGPVNSVVRVTGSNWGPGDVVTLSLGGLSLGSPSASADGQLSVAVRIPAMATGVHPLTASGGGRSAAFPFDVSEPATVDTGAGASPDATASGAVRTGGRIAATDTAASGTNVVSSSPLSGTSGGELVGEPVTNGAPGAAGPLAAAGGGVPPGGTARAGTDTGGGRPRGRSASPTGVASAAGKDSPVGTGATAVTVSPGSAQGDLWSGFAPGPAGTSRPRGLADLAGPAPSSGPSPLVVGTGLAVIGMLALGVGFASAEVGRRRVLAHTDSADGRSQRPREHVS